MSKTITTVNPATGKPIQTYETTPADEVQGIVSTAHEAHLRWREMPVEERAGSLTRVAEVLRAGRDKYAQLITLEMGKLIGEARAEVEKCAFLCDVYAENGLQWLREESVTADGREHRVAFEPLGVILSIMPWNFPFWQALRFGVPTLLAGNASVLKHASNVPQCAMAIEEVFREAELPAGVFRTVFADHQTVAELIASPLIPGVSLTGSTEAGVRIAKAAGEHLKKCVLELGGSDPFIVLDDVDIDIAAAGAVMGRMICTGQSCIAAKRFIVVESVAESFTQNFAQRMSALQAGDPADEQTQVGPLVNVAGLNELQDQLQRSVDMGAVVVTGGERLRRDGFYLAPTVVSGVTAEMPIAREEVFGPIAPIIAVKDEDEAVQVANDSIFGLGGCVWTRNVDRGQRLARRLEVGTTFVNSIVKSDPRMPFGGVKQSGLGRELSKYGLREFVNVKGINVYDHG